MNTLARIGGVRVVDPLMSVAKGTDSYLRIVAIRALAGIEGPKASTALVELLDSSSLTRRTEVMNSLGSYSSSSRNPQLKQLKPLQKALADSHPSIRRLAVKALVERRHKGLSGTLIKCLKDTDAEVRITAVNAMGNAPRTDDITAALIKALGDSESGVRAAAVGCLIKSSIPPKAVKLLADILIEQVSLSPDSGIKTEQRMSSSVLRRLVDALGTSGDKRVIPALLAARDDKRDSYVRTAAVRALGRMGDKSLAKHLIDLLKDSSRDVRLAAVEALCKTDQALAVKAIIPMLKDSDRSVRREVIRKLGESRDKRAIKPLMELVEDTDASVRQAGVIALVQVDSKLGYKPYATYLKRMGSSRRDLAEAMEKMGKDDLVEALIAALKHESSTVVRSALYELRLCGDQRAMEPIKELLKTATGSSSNILFAAKSAIRAITARHKKP